MRKARLVREHELCSRCKQNPAEELHGCPYAEDVGNNHDQEYCDCCNKCRRECLADI